MSPGARDERRRIVRDVFAETVALHQRVAESVLATVILVAEAIEGALAAGGKVLAFGNGGSAADAQHFAAELVGRFARERPALPVIALTSDTSVLTSVGNDYSFEQVFTRQIEALGRAGDVALGISTSGGSPNVAAALARARAGGLLTVALTGQDGGVIGRTAELHLNVPHASTARVQEVHRTLLHAICELIERDLPDARFPDCGTKTP